MIKDYIKTVENYPKKGVSYKDIQPLLANPAAFKMAVVSMGQLIDKTKVDYYVGIDARGFIFASALASTNYGAMKLIRKANKLPSEDIVTVGYDLEYGSDAIQMERGSGNVVIVDDVYATGGTMDAAKELCEKAGYTVVDTVCLVNVGLCKSDTKCLISY